jgi:hypothetical protein
MLERRIPYTLIRHLCALGAAALLAAACEGNVLTQQSLGAVVTVVDSGPALQSARTFVLPDTVITLTQMGTPISAPLARQIVADVRTHFTSLGWVEILMGEPALRPDVVVVVAASTRIQTGILYTDWYSAWGFLPYWGTGVDPSWAWGMPAGAVPYAYQAGTLLVTMLDVRTPRDDTKTIPMLWAAGLDGVVGDASTVARIHAGIDQAFAQSPYLQLH